MARLSDVIKDDFKNVGPKVGAFAKGLVRGGIQGLYTPFLINTGVKQFCDELERESDRDYLEIFTKTCAQIIGTAFTIIPLAVYAIHKGWGKEYFGAMIATNIGDYLVNAYKRAKRRTWK